jgi:hypothetical protein
MERPMKVSCIPITLATIIVACLSLAATHAQQVRQPREGLRLPVYRPGQASLAATPVAAPAPTAPSRFSAVEQVAQQTPAAPRQAFQAQPAQAEAAEEHPLASKVRMAEKLLEDMRANVKDYSATLVKRERVDGVLLDYQYMAAKIRQEQLNERGEVVTPFSVYLNFVAPETVKGREVIYVKGRNDGKLTAHDGGSGIIAAIRSSVTVNLDPTAPRAMQGNKYPITDIGMENLLKKLIEVAELDMKHGEVDVKTFEGTKINGRVCTCLQTVHPVPRDHFRFHIARIYIDDEHKLPIRYESYGWPQSEGAKPPLLEEYTYLDLKLNNGFTDRDFDPSNPSYNFN